MGIFSPLRHSAWSMRRKLFGYMLILTTLLMAALMTGLFLFGRYDSAGQKTYEALDIQMEVFEKDVSTHFDSLAAASIRFSEDMVTFLEEYLTGQEISFSELNDSDLHIASLQDALIEPLRQKLLQETCSGIFVMLDATVNGTLINASTSRTGLYLQQSGYDNSDESVLLYRGSSDISKKHGIMPHRKWRLEFQTDLFPNYTELISAAGLPVKDNYILTDRFTLPGTSEDAVLMVSPIVGSDGTFYGLCGYEVSASCFTTYHAQPTKIAHLTCLFTTGSSSSLDPMTGLSCGGTDNYYRAPKGVLEISPAGNGLCSFTGGETAYIGVTKEVVLTPNNESYTLAVMMLRSDYDKAVTRTYLQNIVLWALLLFFSVSCCMYFSRQYLSPILKGLEQIKSDKRAEARSTIPEINDLFAFLAAQDRAHEASLNTLAQEKKLVQNEKNRLQLEYEQAQTVYEKAQGEYLRAQRELTDARQQLERLAYSRKNEIDPDDYQSFLMGMETLTKTERAIFDLYLSGKSAKEILGLTGTKESTLKFHNHNILNKLGVSSRKQMLRYAALMQQEQGERLPENSSLTQ